MKLTELAALKATRQQWKEIADTIPLLEEHSIWWLKTNVPSYEKTCKKYSLSHVDFNCFLCEFSTGSPGNFLSRDCNMCPLRTYWLSEKGVKYIMLPRVLHKPEKRIFERTAICETPGAAWFFEHTAICETPGAAWYDFKHAKTQDLYIEAALRIIKMCDAAIKVIHYRNVQRRH